MQALQSLPPLLIHHLIFTLVNNQLVNKYLINLLSSHYKLGAGTVEVKKQQCPHGIVENKKVRGCRVNRMTRWLQLCR